MRKFTLATYTLWRRELARFLRQPGRIAGALGTPLLFWFFLGSGLGGSFKADQGYLQYFYPGMVALVLLFTAIFSTISIIEDRREGFLQGVLVSPAPRAGIALGKILGGATVAVGQGLLLLALAPLLDLPLGVRALAATALAFLLLAVALTGLGFAFAWRTDSTQGFHAVMNLLLFPMWMLSGAVFPAEGAPPWLRAVVAANPMTYGVEAVRDGLEGTVGGHALATAGFAAAMFALALASMRKP